jgi:hypothetical protein
LIVEHGGMKFLAPWFFWSFLSLIPLVAIYFLKVRPRRKDATAYFLWQKVFTEKRTSSLFQRLRDILSLVLMALTFGAVCLALTKPELQDDSRQDLLIVVDHSASMAAGKGRAQRLELAKEAAGDIIKGLDGTQRAAVASLAGELRFLSHLSDDPKELLDAVSSIQPTELTFNPKALTELSPGESAEFGKQHRVILVSDGCLESGLPESVELLKVGEPLENVGIISADAQYLPGPGNRLGIYFQLASSFKAPVKADLIIKPADGNSIAKLIPLEIKPGVNPSETFAVDEAETGRWLAQIDFADALASDNQAYLVAAKPKPLRVKVEATDAYFLQACVQAFSDAGGLLTPVEENAQFVLGKGTAPDAPMAVIFQPTGTSTWWKSVGEPVEVGAARVKTADHPVLRHLEATGINYTGARQIEPADGALVLVESETSVPLIYTMNANGKSALVVNLDPVAAEFYFSAWFPVLIHGAATHMAGREESLLATYASGSTIPLPGSRETDVTNLEGPAGDDVAVTGKRSAALVKPGFYTLRNPGGEWQAAVSLLAAPESLLDNSALQSNLRPIAQGMPPYLLLTLLGVAVLVVESLLYHRRKVG